MQYCNTASKREQSPLELARLFPKGLKKSYLSIAEREQYRHVVSIREWHNQVISYEILSLASGQTSSYGSSMVRLRLAAHEITAQAYLNQ